MFTLARAALFGSFIFLSLISHAQSHRERSHFANKLTQTRAHQHEILELRGEEILIEATYKPRIRDLYRSKLSVVFSARLKDFESDACSLFPEGDWGLCCEEHDLEYWMGGSRAERKRADKRFKTCIRETGGSALAALMYFGVRLGGSKRWNAPWSWGFGWSYNRPYSSLKHEERELILNTLERQGLEAPQRLQR